MLDTGKAGPFPSCRAKIRPVRDFQEWVPRLKDGDENAWQEFIRAFGRFVPFVSAPLGLSASEMEDVLQETMLTAFRSIHNLREPAGLASWVFTIARRTAIAQLRARRRLRIVDGPEVPDLEHHPSQAIPIDELLSGWEEGQRIREAVATLNPKCRGLIEDLFLNEPRLTYKQLSEKRQMPVGSIGPTLARCLQALRRAWEAVSSEPGAATARVRSKE